MAQRVVIPGFRKIETSGGGEGTGNYNDLQNKPSINNVPLVGNLKTVDLKLTDPTLTEEGVFDGNVTHEEVNDPIFINAGTYPESYIFVRVGVGIPDNTIIKPMITTNLDATYDDFVPYTGNTGKLNSDVASLLKRIEALEALTTKTDTNTAVTE